MKAQVFLAQRLSVCLGLILGAIAIQAAGGAAVTTRLNSSKEQMEKAAKQYD